MYAIQKDLSAALGERDALQDALGSSRDRVVSLEKKLGDAVKRGEDAKRAREESVRAASEGDAKFRAALQAAVSLRFFWGLVGSWNGLGISICVVVRSYETNPRQRYALVSEVTKQTHGSSRECFSRKLERVLVRCKDCVAIDGLNPRGPFCYRRAKP